MNNFIVLLIVLFLGTCVFAEKSMVDLNPDFEYNIISAQKCFNIPGNAYKAEKAFSLFHFSDTHGDIDSLKRCVDFYKHYQKYFDDIVCTGDVVEKDFFDDFTYWGKVKGAEYILQAVGNHDMLYDKNWDWSIIAPEKEAYDKYFAPFIKNWNADYTEGHTYYYKDYPEKKFRIISINCRLIESDEKEQFSWFEKVLNDAKYKELAVIILYHIPLRNKTAINIKCNWTDPDYGNVTSDTYTDKYQVLIDQFMADGGEFVCWLGGHTHWDFVGYNSKHPKQLNICVDAANLEQSVEFNDLIRIKGTRSQDLANAFVVDKYSHTIKLIRVGANFTSYMQPRNFFCINYKTFEILAQN